jgi:intracellular sulfur oxidation DsrE/DsrF family protein
MYITKNHFLLLPLLFLAFVFSPLTSVKAETSPEAKNYALLISKPRHVKGVLKMLESMRKDKARLQYENARVVLYGDAIHTAKKGSEIASIIAEAKKHNITVAVCNQALTRLKVPTTEILPTVEVVDNAYYEMLRLKTLGYISLDL